jgi:tetratricopeptide (TPR) repeat protein
MKHLIFPSCVWIFFLCVGCKPKPSSPTADKKAPDVVATRPNPDLAPAAKTPSPEFLEHLKTGRKYEASRQWPQAVAEFEAALKVFPDEPRAVNELGWAAFQAGDLEKAKKANEQALAGSVTPQQKGAALYNMGRVAEAAKDFKAAIDFYKRSVEVRPNSEAERRLKGLTLSDEPILAKGPFDSIKAMCPELKKLESRLDIDDEYAEDKPSYTFEFTCQNDELKRVTAGLPPPLAEVVFFTSSALATNHPGRNHCTAGCITELFLNAAVRVGKKWHLLADIDRGLAFAEGIQILEAAVKPVGPAGAKLLVVRLHVDTSLSNMFASEHEGITVIGAGPSGQPAMLPIVETLKRDGVYPYGEGATVEETESRREVRFEDGMLVAYRLTEIPDTQVKRPKKKVTDLNERHKIAFP